MMLKNKKFLMLASAAIIALPVTVVHATTTNMDATATFLTAITLTPTTMDFGGISYTTAVAGDTASLGTDSTIGYAGTWAAGGGTPAAGTVQVTAGTDGQTVEVSCDTTAQMGDGGGNTIDVVSLEVVSETAGPGAFGTGIACAGIGTPSTTMVLDVSGGTADMFYFGGQIDGSTASVGFAGGAFSTATGGNDIQVDVVYQ